MYLLYFLLGATLFFGARWSKRGEWNEDYASLAQTKALLGAMALGVALHHMAQKTCAPWHPSAYTVHGLDAFLQVGYLFVGAFLFCSGLGLYRSLHDKPDYLRGFLRRRVLPVVIAFYLSEWLYTAIRLLMGEPMDALTVLWYLSGLHLANFNGWYLVVIVFFYLAFWAAFRACKREGAAIFCLFAFTLVYTALGALVDQQRDWWMEGEWWYNSILLFPLGLLFGKYEKTVAARVKRGYPLWLALSAAAALALFRQSEWLKDNAWGYYGAWNDPMRVPHRLMSAGMQWLAATAFVAFCFLLMMKLKPGNAALRWLGRETLAFYLVHSAFVELFGYNFLDISKSLVYIRSVPLYAAAVLACSVCGTVLFGFVWRSIVALALRERPPARDRHAARVKSGARRGLRRLIVPGVAAAALLALLFPFFGVDRNVRVMNGLEFHIPDGFTRKYSERRYAVWEYDGADARPGNLVLDADIRDGKARNLHTAEEVLAECDWLTEAEIYVNPQGVRMVRGYANYTGSPERRYYIESPGTVLLMCMLEDARYYDRDDCEAALRRVAEDVRPAQG